MKSTSIIFLLLIVIFSAMVAAFYMSGQIKAALICVLLAILSLLIFVVIVTDASPKKKKQSVAADEERKRIVEEELKKQQIEAEERERKKKEEEEQRRIEEQMRILKEKKEAFASRLSHFPRVEIIRSESPEVRAPIREMPEFRASNITRSTNIENLFPIVVVDVETTGLYPSICKIVEISAIKLDEDYHVLSCFTTLVNPGEPIPAEATKINHITDEMVSDAPSFAAIRESFSEYIRGCTLSGHNLMSFDLKFLYANGVELSGKVKYIDTLELAKKMLKSSHSKRYNREYGEYVEVDDWDVYDYKLETLCDYYGIYRDDAHRSLSDCYATGLLLEKLIFEKTQS